MLILCDIQGRRMRLVGILSLAMLLAGCDFFISQKFSRATIEFTEKRSTRPKLFPPKSEIRAIRIANSVVTK